MSNLKSILSSGKISDTTIYFGFLIFVLSLPFDKLTLFLNIGMSLVLIGWIGRIIYERKLGWHRTPLDIPIVLFLGLALIASLLAPNQSDVSIGYIWKLLRAILLFFAVVHNRLGRKWRHVLIAFFVSAGISSMLGIWYYINGSGLAHTLMGQVGLEYQNELANGEGFSNGFRADLHRINIPLSQTASIVQTKKTDEWRIDDLVRDRRYFVETDEAHLNVYMIEQRLTGTFKAPNYLGAYLALGLPFMLGFLVASWQSLRKQKYGIWIVFALSAVVIMMSVNLVLTLTRGAWVGVAVGILGICLYLVVVSLSKIEPLGNVLKCVLIGIILISMTLGAYSYLTPQHIKTRFHTLVERPAGFLGERPQWWGISLDLIQEYPIIGVGMGRFRHDAQLIAPPNVQDIPYHAHNIYLHIAVEQGIPSLLLFLWMVGLFWKQLWIIRSTIGDRGDFWKIGAFIGGSGFLISTLVYGTADYIFHHRSLLLFWFIIGIIYYIQVHEDEIDEKCT